MHLCQASLSPLKVDEGNLGACYRAENQGIWVKEYINVVSKTSLPSI